MTSAAEDPPLHMVAAALGPTFPPPSDREAFARLGQSIAAASAETEADGVLVRLIDLVAGLVDADAVTIELRGAESGHGPHVLVHRGLRPDEVVTPLRSSGSEPVSRGPTRFAHRLSFALTGPGARPGELVLWRADRPFGAVDEERGGVAAEAIAVLLYQFLRRVKVEQRQHWLNASAEISEALLSSVPGPTVLRLVVRWCREVSGCDLAWLVTGSGPDDLALKVVSTPDDAPAGSAPTQLPVLDLTSSLTGHVIATGLPVQVPDLTVDSRVSDEVLLPQWSQLGPAVVVPIQIDTQSVGALGLAWRADRAASFLSLDPTLPSRFVKSLAVSIRVGDARADAKRLAVLEERERIRLDLHDHAIQRLYALGLALEAARLRPERTSVDQLLDGLVQRVDETIAEIRRTLAGLGALDNGMNLYDAMVDIVARAAVSAPFQPELRVFGLSQAAVGAEPAGHLLAVLEESLSNVTRHAQASRCRVTLRVDERLTLVVDDDGVGVPEAVVGSGLENLRRRAEASSGELTIVDKAPGTRLTWSVPAVAPAWER